MPVLGAQTDHADGRHQQRRRQPHAEQLHRQVPLGCPDEHARDQAPLGERADVGSLGVFAARAAGHVGQHRRRQRLLGPGLELGERHREAGQDPLQPGQVDLQLKVPEGGHLDIKAHGELQPFCTCAGTRAATRPGLAISGIRERPEDAEHLDDVPVRPRPVRGQRGGDRDVPGPDLRSWSRRATSRSTWTSTPSSPTCSARRNRPRECHGRAERPGRGASGGSTHQAPASGGGTIGGTIASIRCGPGSA